MIQTQLLKLDPPYQIISAGGRAGIQVATLIVTEDKTENGRYAIDTHSHPVVNYGLKQGLEEELKYNNNPDPDARDEITRRLQPESAVWNKVEIGDVKVLGLAGAHNDLIDLRTFVSLVPVEYVGGMPTWNMQSLKMLYSLGYNLSKVGLKLARNDHDYSLLTQRNGNLNVRLMLIVGVDPLVRVWIKEEGEHLVYEEDMPIYFDVRIFDESGPTDDEEKFTGTENCEAIIIQAMKELRSIFFWNTRLSFFYWRTTDPNLVHTDNALERITEKLNAEFNPK